MIKKKKHFDFLKFFVYLTCGLALFGAWFGYNYSNYVELQKNTEIVYEQNAEIIDETVKEIEEQQEELQMVQRTVSPPPPAAGVMSMDGGDPTYIELEKRIKELEEEKKEFLAEKKSLKANVGNILELLKWDVSNPLLNVVILPLLLYAGKRALDVLTKLAEKKLELT